MTTATATAFNHFDMEEKKASTMDKIHHMIQLHKRYEGLFTPSQCCLALGVTKQRFHVLADQLEHVSVPEMGGREFITGRSLIEYRERAKNGRPFKNK